MKAHAKSAGRKVVSFVAAMRPCRGLRRWMSTIDTGPLGEGVAERRCIWFPARVTTDAAKDRLVHLNVPCFAQFVGLVRRKRLQMHSGTDTLLAISGLRSPYERRLGVACPGADDH